MSWKKSSKLGAKEQTHGMGYRHKKKIYQRLANEIFFRILDGRYPLGSKLLSYIDISKEAGSSPETVRKAICVLQRSRLIDKTRWGNFVTTEQSIVLEYRNTYLASIEQAYTEAREKAGVSASL